MLCYTYLLTYSDGRSDSIEQGSIDDNDDSYRYTQLVCVRLFFFYKHIFGLHTAHQVPRDAFHSHR